MTPPSCLIPLPKSTLVQFQLIPMQELISRIKRLGTGREQPDAKREPYNVNDVFTERLEDWKESVEFQRLLDTLRESYIRFKADNPSHPDIDFMQRDAANGFILDVYNLELPMEKCILLMTHWRESILKEHYFDSMSDITVKAGTQLNHVLLRHYLKPSKRKLGMSDQKYGNIELVLNIQGDQPQHIKLQANTYSDAQYDEPEEFGHLLFKITQS